MELFTSRLLNKKRTNLFILQLCMKRYKKNVMKILILIFKRRMANFILVNVNEYFRKLLVFRNALSPKLNVFDKFKAGPLTYNAVKQNY